MKSNSKNIINARTIGIILGLLPFIIAASEALVVMQQNEKQMSLQYKTHSTGGNCIMVDLSGVPSNLLLNATNHVLFATNNETGCANLHTMSHMNMTWSKDAALIIAGIRVFGAIGESALNSSSKAIFCLKHFLEGYAAEHDINITSNSHISKALTATAIFLVLFVALSLLRFAKDVRSALDSPSKPGWLKATQEAALMFFPCGSKTNEQAAYNSLDQ